MQPNSLIEWIALIASLATIVSVPVNVIQWRTTATLKRQYYSKIFAEYNHMYRIAELADRAKHIYKNATIPEAEHWNISFGISNKRQELQIAYGKKYKLIVKNFCVSLCFVNIQPNPIKPY
jgi:hypothetical protein